MPTFASSPHKTRPVPMGDASRCRARSATDSWRCVRANSCTPTAKICSHIPLNMFAGRPLFYEGRDVVRCCLRDYFVGSDRENIVATSLSSSRTRCIHSTDIMFVLFPCVRFMWTTSLAVSGRLSLPKDADYLRVTASFW